MAWYDSAYWKAGEFAVAPFYPRIARASRKIRSAARHIVKTGVHPQPIRSFFGGPYQRTPYFANYLPTAHATWRPWRRPQLPAPPQRKHTRGNFRRKNKSTPVTGGTGLAKGSTNLSKGVVVGSTVATGSAAVQLKYLLPGVFGTFPSSLRGYPQIGSSHDDAGRIVAAEYGAPGQAGPSGEDKLDIRIAPGQKFYSN